MARTKISEFSATPGNNTDIDSINIAENCAPSGINDAIRELMAQLKDFQTGAVGDSFNGPVGTTTAAAGAFTTLSASSTVSGTGFSTYLASPPSIGSTAAGSGAFTTLSASGAVTLSGGTANGVTYLNGSKVLTSGSALTFDGNSLIAQGVAAYQANFQQTNANSYGEIRVTGSSRGGQIEFMNGATRLSGLYGDTANNLFFVNGTGDTVRATLDSSGNLGLGVTPSAWSATSYKTFEIGSIGNAINSGTNDVLITANAYFNSGWKYGSSGSQASFYNQNAGTHIWKTAPSGTAGNAITFTQAMTLDASGRLAINQSSAAYRLDIKASPASNAYDGINILNSAGNGSVFTFGQTGTAYSYGSIGSNQSWLYSAYGDLNITCDQYSGGGSGVIKFSGASGAERARIDSSGNWTVGSNGGTNRALVANAQYTESVAWNGSVTSAWIGKNNSSGRSVSAAGTLNASGADYAEYMTKSGDFNIAKGDVVGINADGKLTNVFADAVSFCVKSTDPSYVGGDSWGVGFEDDAEGLEAARQRVDRIAFAGQVPVNVTGATAGQYIVPVNDNGAIKGEAVSNPTFEQYQQAVGKVIAIETDGRARIIVKVA